MPDKKRQRPGFSLYLCLFSVSYFPCRCWRRAFPVRQSSDPDAAYSGTEQIAPLHREALPTSALHIAAAQPAAKDPRSIHRLFCDPLKRSSPLKAPSIYAYHGADEPGHSRGWSVPNRRSRCPNTGSKTSASAHPHTFVQLADVLRNRLHRFFRRHQIKRREPSRTVHLFDFLNGNGLLFLPVIHGNCDVSGNDN